MYKRQVIDASGRPSRKTHVGILPYKADIFDRTDVRIMVAKEDTDPEAFLVALNIDKSVYNSQYNAEKHRALDSSSRKLLAMDAGKLDLADLGAADKPLLDSSRNGGSGYGVCEGDCDKDSDCGIGLMCFQRGGNEPVPGCSGTPKSGWDYCVAIKAFDSSMNGLTGNAKCNCDGE